MNRGMGDEHVGGEPDQHVAISLADAAAEVDIVLDYLWATPAQQAIIALLTKRSDRSRALNWIQIGANRRADDGASVSRPGSATLRIQDNGQGAVSTQACLGELPSLVHEIHAGTITVTPNVIPPLTSSRPGPTQIRPASAPCSRPELVPRGQARRTRRAKPSVSVPPGSARRSRIRRA